jgi:thioesterase domain-containing protein
MNSAERPLVFVLPGLGGEEDPELEKFWEPSRNLLDIVSVTYLDWTELVRQGADFTAMVAHVKHQIESRSPLGPVRMAGYSIGGHLAYACATQFHAQGRPVQCMAILDAPVTIGESAPGLGARLRARLDMLLDFDLRAGLASLLAKILIREPARPLLKRISRYRQSRLPFSFDAYLHRKITMQLVRRIFPPWWRGMARPPSRLTAPTVLFRSEEHEPREREDLGWGDYCVDLKVVPVAGSHRGMLDPEHNGPLRAAFVRAMTMARS